MCIYCCRKALVDNVSRTDFFICFWIHRDSDKAYAQCRVVVITHTGGLMPSPWKYARNSSLERMRRHLVRGQFTGVHSIHTLKSNRSLQYRGL